jgi:hypothetical protein
MVKEEKRNIKAWDHVEKSDVYKYRVPLSNTAQRNVTKKVKLDIVIKRY